MAQNELHKQELLRHQEQVDRHIEQQQALYLAEKERGIAAANQNSTVARIVHIIYYSFGVLELLLLLRVVLHFVNANSGNSFANFIDGLSYPFVALFANLVANPVFGTNSVLEVTTLIAMLVWAIVAWVVGRLVWLTLSRPR